MLGAAFQPEHYDVTKESRLTCATVNTYPSHMRALGTSILPSASKMCIFSSLLLEKNSTWKLVTLLDGSKPFFLSLSKYLLYDTYIYISIYILQKKKKARRASCDDIFYSVSHACERPQGWSFCTPRFWSGNRNCSGWETHEKQTTFHTVKSLHKHKQDGLSRHATCYCNACVNNLRICSVPTGCSFER